MLQIEKMTVAQLKNALTKRGVDPKKFGMLRAPMQKALRDAVASDSKKIAASSHATSKPSKGSSQSADKKSPNNSSPTSKKTLPVPAPPAQPNQDAEWLTAELQMKEEEYRRKTITWREETALRIATLEAALGLKQATPEASPFTSLYARFTYKENGGDVLDPIKIRSAILTLSLDQVTALADIVQLAIPKDTEIRQARTLLLDRLAQLEQEDEPAAPARKKPTMKIAPPKDVPPAKVVPKLAPPKPTTTAFKKDDHVRVRWPDDNVIYDPCIIQKAKANDIYTVWFVQTDESADCEASWIVGPSTKDIKAHV